MEEVVETIAEEAIVIAETAADKIGIGEAAVYAILGYVVVFFGISLLMFVVMAMGKAFIAKDRKAAAAKAAAAPTAAPVEAPKPTAPGSAGELKLHDVEPKIAAMLMAIVADKMGKPLNELRFISIKEVK
ncbi:MAG: OadG family protein [Clostridiales bacterium]|nr:OadG family protein [Clostridiales bacterium]MCI6434852.1 OadG family protein [Clostridiales bacterium]